MKYLRDQNGTLRYPVNPGGLLVNHNSFPKSGSHCSTSNKIPNNVVAHKLSNSTRFAHVKQNASKRKRNSKSQVFMQAPSRQSVRTSRNNRLTYSHLNCRSQFNNSPFESHSCPRRISLKNGVGEALLV